MKNSFLLFFLFSGGGLSSLWGQTGEVNLFLGTSGDHGQLAPSVSIPFGMVQACPDSNPRQHAGYDYAVPLISGISINRLSGVGGQGCGGNVSLMPDTSAVNVQIVKATEKAVPGYYHTYLSNGVRVELTATRTTAVERFAYPNRMIPTLWVNPSSSFEKVYDAQVEIHSSHAIGGQITAANTCGKGRYKLYYYLATDIPFRLVKKDGTQMKLEFPSGKPVEVRIAVSPISVVHARENFMKEKNISFDTIRCMAFKAWDNLLSRIQLKGGSADERALFYTSLLRVCHSPFQVTEGEGDTFPGTNGKLYQAVDYDYYSSWSLWDTYRTKFPLLTLLVPKYMSGMMQSLAFLYQTGKQDWSTDCECAPTVRTEHASLLLLDCYRKGILIPNLRDAYPGMKEEADHLPLSSPDQCLEAVSDLWALAQVAEELEYTVDASAYQQRADSLFCTVWKREFCYIDSSYVNMKRNGLYQGTRWQYRWAVPQYLHRMEEMVGRDSLEAQLTVFFDYNLYNQGNEPDIHVPYLFNRLGSPEKTQQTVYRLIDKEVTHLYGGNAEYPVPYVGKAFMNAPVGYCPEMDEDDGAMSAWYVFSAMGLYPLMIGEPYYELASPLFDEVKLYLPGNKTFTIRTVGRQNMAQPIYLVKLNGKRLDNYRLSHAELMSGGILELVYAPAN